MTAIQATAQAFNAATVGRRLPVLFSREGKRLTPTAEGLYLYQRSSVLLRDVSLLRQDVRVDIAADSLLEETDYKRRGHEPVPCDDEAEAFVQSKPEQVGLPSLRIARVEIDRVRP